jgi:MSHA biogenesis protein MshJ
MKQSARRVFERLDAAPLRQRVLVFVAALLAVAFVADAILIAPLRGAQQRLGNAIAQKQKEAASLAAAARDIAEKGRTHPDVALRERQAELQRELAQVDARIVQERKRFTPPERMRGALEEMLRANPRLSLVELRTLAPVALGEAAAGNAAAGTPRGLFRHGLEITVAGTYVDFYEYLRTLERLPTQLYWGRAELAVGTYPSAVLKLTVYTVSFDPAWLVV